MIGAVFEGRNFKNRWELGCSTFWFITSCCPYFDIKRSWRWCPVLEGAKWCGWGGCGWSCACLSQWLQQSYSKLFPGFIIVLLSNWFRYSVSILLSCAFSLSFKIFSIHAGKKMISFWSFITFYWINRLLWLVPLQLYYGYVISIIILLFFCWELKHKYNVGYYIPQLLQKNRSYRRTLNQRLPFVSKYTVKFYYD